MLKRRTALAACAALVAGLSAFTFPSPPIPSADTTGDPGLAAELRTATAGLTGQGFAAVRGNATTSVEAAIGAAAPGRPLTTDTPQEIGSITKSMTGWLFADMVGRGEVAPSTTLAEVYPDLTGELAATTLEELATHTSGLPRLSTRAHVASFWTNLTYGNPYAKDTPESLLQDASSTWLRTPRGEYSYSNLGYALLGNALATVAGEAYPELLAERVTGPLGMTATAAAPPELPADRARELGADGRPSTPWSSTGSTPAGIGVYSTPQDLGRLARAAAQDPQEWGWISAELQGRTVVGNNGATYGVQASVWTEPATGEWVVVTSPSGSATVDTEGVALALLGVA
jgi:CubicO group peptidase (beta-lactamase class C family)